ncbi:EPIDERMAL PATTERNING FACTOR-like protein 2 [Diospyros lotus]|uniref:EPIDERMAL PATTERNING FACTOR-like protein 2 n=1 Tax=Diospyros lotus TaxID=55363 RepID=UPI00224EEC60|nr:EPIDERMAL PATTERNING FACTOR-like protein 2 [Diospyros lotus]
MEGIIVRLLCLVMVVQILSWVCVTSSSRPLEPLLPSAGQTSPGSSKAIFTSPKHQGSKRPERVTERSGSTSSSSSPSFSYELVGKRMMGSSPPNCEDKCFGCTPCEAIQVPATATGWGVQYANYEPEGWKCKCGHSIYTP